MKRARLREQAQNVLVGITLLALLVCIFSWDVVREWAATVAYIGFVLLAALRAAGELLRGGRDAV